MVVVHGDVLTFMVVVHGDESHGNKTNKSPETNPESLKGKMWVLLGEGVVVPKYSENICPI